MNQNKRNKKTSSNVERTTTGNANDYPDQQESGSTPPEDQIQH